MSESVSLVSFVCVCVLKLLWNADRPTYAQQGVTQLETH